MTKSFLSYLKACSQLSGRSLKIGSSASHPERTGIKKTVKCKEALKAYLFHLTTRKVALRPEKQALGLKSYLPKPI
ncbi:hypothetical protein ACFLZP_03640, partial [Patescibacteria group bacterium]